MKPKNLVLRRRLVYVESQLETESVSSRHSPRLKQDRQRRLTEEKIAIQKSLESIVYPILTIPFEITAEIFVHCLPALPGQPSGSVAPMLLARICRQWRNIACSTPRLWAALRTDRRKGPNLALLAHMWFGRAGGAPKSLFLRIPFYHCSGSSDTCHFQHCPSFLPFTDHWAHLSSFHGTGLTPADCLGLLTRAPRLTHCEFGSFQDFLPFDPASSRLLLASLEHLSFTTFRPDIRPLLSLLDSITCPALRSFDVSASFRNFADALFLSFLERAPSIKVFTIAFYTTIRVFCL
ncbi:hypothetical protein C8R46DRAFT_1256749 [Mycena filopes]|nr:hypothetical protein C8R46DRAFT_1256749 [Mycena filopes]